MILGIRGKRLTFAQRGVLNVRQRAAGVDHRVDGHREDRLREKRLVQRVCQTDVLAAVAEDDARDGVVSIGVVHIGRVHLERGFAGLLVQNPKRLIRRDLVVEALRQAQGCKLERGGVGEDEILLQAVARHGVAHRQAGKDVFIEVLGLQLGDVAAALLFGFDFRREIRRAQALRRAADELRHPLRQLDEALLLQLRAGARLCGGWLRGLFQLPCERPAVLRHGRHVAAVHLDGELHAHAVRAVAQHLPALRGDGFFEGVVDLLPRLSVRIAKVDGLGVDNRLAAVHAHVEVLHVFLTARDLFGANALCKKPIHALGLVSLFGEVKERLRIVF